MELTPYLKLMVDKGASDLFFSAGAPINIKIEGISQPINKEILPYGKVKQLAYTIMNEQQKKEFEATLEMNLAISVNNVGRFRVNIFRQRSDVAMVIRYIKSKIPTIDELNLPPVLKELILQPRGLVLIVGTTGSGKSTTLASMIDYRNSIKTGHILTIEDPIEFIHHHKKSIVDQREVGLDTLNYKSALENALREAPDVILIGEIRDMQTMQQAIAYAETGHLCLSTLHSTNAYQTLERIVNFFPEASHQQLFNDLSLNLNAVVSQRLLAGKNGKRLPAVEIMLNTPYISELIQIGEIVKIREAMEQNKETGMQTFDQSVFDLYNSDKVELEEALSNADSRNNLQVKIRIAEGVDDANLTETFSMNNDEYKR